MNYNFACTTISFMYSMFRTAFHVWFQISHSVCKLEKLVNWYRTWFILDKYTVHDSARTPIIIIIRGLSQSTDISGTGTQFKTQQEHRFLSSFVVYLSQQTSLGEAHSSRLSKNTDYYRNSWSISVNRHLWERYTLQDPIKTPIILVIFCLH
jgi:hypothetical protein